jgi:hypothetical protein
VRSWWIPVLVAVVGVTVALVLFFARDTAPEPVAAQPCGDRMFGHVRSLERRADRYELRFDPAFWLSGETANTAAAEDGAVAPGEPVPNDYYIVDESKRTLRYFVRPGAHVTVLVNNRTGILSTPITVSELAEIVHTGKSGRRTLFESLESGVWIRVKVDTVCSLDQQYRP